MESVWASQRLDGGCWAMDAFPAYTDGMWLLLALGCAPTPSPAGGRTVEQSQVEASEGDTAAVDTGTETPEPRVARLLFNEVQASNDATWMSEPGTFPDWVEVFNADIVDVDLSEVSILRNGEASLPLAGLLPPGAHAIWSSGDLGFGIPRTGAELELQVGGRVADRVATGLLPTDTSLARFPDGRAWQPTARPTPGWTNGSAPSASLDPSARLFDDRTVHAIALTVSEDGLESLAVDRRTEVPASVQIRGVWFPEVGVRLKGQIGSRRRLDQKAAWKVDLNEYEGHSIYGQEMLTVNNMVQDPSYVAEHLAYSVYRAAGIPAPRTSWARLSVNGDDWGLYSLIETVDDNFLGRWFVDPDGRMWEGKYGQDFVDGDIMALDFDQGVDDDRSTLLAVSDILSGPADAEAIIELERYVALDQWLLNVAVESLIRHWDGYSTSNNYRIYEDPVSGRLHLLPWGTDQTFRDLRVGPIDTWGDIHQFCMREPACEQRFLDHLLAVADIMDDLELEAEMDQHLAMLSEDIASDPRREFSLDTHQQTVEVVRQTIRVWPDEVRAAVATRRGL